MDSSQNEDIDPDYEQAFPARLHYLLDVLEKDGMGHVCSFQSHGRAFVVRDKAAFVKDILPKWFRQSRWASFQRQLNHYEFQRITTGPDQGAYYHPHFLKGSEHRDLCRFIRRIKVKGNGPRKPSSPATEPNFYKHPPLSLRAKGSSDMARLLSKAKPRSSPSHERTKNPQVGMTGTGLVSGLVSERDYVAERRNVGHNRRVEVVDAWDAGSIAPTAWMNRGSPPPSSWGTAVAVGAFPRSLESMLLSAASRAAAATAFAGGVPHPHMNKVRASRHLLAMATVDAMAAASAGPKLMSLAPFRPTPAGGSSTSLLQMLHSGNWSALHRPAMTTTTRSQGSDPLTFNQVATTMH